MKLNKKMIALRELTKNGFEIKLSKEQRENNKKELLKSIGLTEAQYEAEKKIRHNEMIKICEELRYAQEHSGDSKIIYENNLQK